MSNLKIANKDGFRWGEKAFLVGNEFGVRCVSYANHEQEALDHAVNEGFLDADIMSEEDHAEYDKNGYHDSFCYAGNASQPIWSEYLWIKPAIERKKDEF